MMALETLDTEPIFVPGRLLGTSYLPDDRDETTTRIDEELMSASISDDDDDDDDDDGAFSDVTPSHDALHRPEVTSSVAGPFVREARQLRRQNRCRVRPRGQQQQQLQQQQQQQRVVDDMRIADTLEENDCQQLTTSSEQAEYSSA